MDVTRIQFPLRRKLDQLQRESIATLKGQYTLYQKLEKQIQGNSERLGQVRSELSVGAGHLLTAKSLQLRSIVIEKLQGQTKQIRCELSKLKTDIQHSQRALQAVGEGQEKLSELVKIATNHLKEKKLEYEGEELISNFITSKSDPLFGETSTGSPYKITSENNCGPLDLPVETPSKGSISTLTSNCLLELSGTVQSDRGGVITVKATATSLDEAPSCSIASDSDETLALLRKNRRGLTARMAARGVVLRGLSIQGGRFQ